MNRWILTNVNAVTPDGIVKNASLLLEKGRVARITTESSSLSADTIGDGKGMWAVPAFVDLHIHGFGGFGPEQNTPQSLLKLSNLLAGQGVAAFCPTLYCAKPDAMAAQVQALLPALGQETGAQILGFHLEGPFISPRKPGIMNPDEIAIPNLADFKKIYEAAQGHIRIVTLAPELPGIRPVVDFCVKHRIIVQAGHTNATYEQMKEALSWGVRRVTHWGNAMRGLHQREPGVFGAALLEEKISCEVIADYKHIHPALLKLLKQVKSLEQITAVTDSLLPTGKKKGPFLANGQEVVLSNGVWKREKDLVIAGSALTMARALRRLVQAGFTLEQAVACTSTNPAKLLGLPGGKIAEKAPADIVLLDKNLQVDSVILQAKPYKETL